MRIEPGTEVVWTSQSQGYVRQKRGTVVAFMPAGAQLLSFLSSVEVRRSQIKVQPSTYRSAVDRYLVEVPRGGRKLRWYYAPLASVVESQNPKGR